MANPNAIYETVRAYRTERSAQNLSHTWKGTIPIGALIPVGLYEVLPSDIARVNSEVFCRLMPTLAPIMHEVDVYVHHFEVPLRLLWDNYEKFLIPQAGETENSIPIPPYLTMSNFSNATLRAKLGLNSLADYLGVPPVPSTGSLTNSNDRRVSILPFLAYQLIYNSYYRSEDLDSEVDVNYFKSLNGALTSATVTKLSDVLTLRYRAWEKDIFTSALPRAQLNGPARVTFNQFAGNLEIVVDRSEGTPKFTKQDGTVVGSGTLALTSGVPQAGGANQYYDPDGTLKVASEAGTGTGYFDVETLRAMIAKQETMELLLRGGHRLNEVTPMVFNVTPDDLTIGRPRYLGGGKQNLVMSEVLSHTENTELNLGSMAGHGISYGSDNSFRHQFKEHGYVMSILSVRPRAAYGQGIDKLWTKFDRDSYAWPLYAHLGEQPVKKGQLYFSYTDGKNDETFGYQPIYTDYRSIPSSIHGDLRDSLKFWHMNRLFSSRPELNSDFIHINPSDFDRCFPVESEYAQGVQMVAEISNHAKFIRPIPSDGTPKLII